MKHKAIILLALFCLSASYVSAQITRETRLLDLPQFSELELNLPADVIIDCRAASRLEITAETETFEAIEIENQGSRIIIRSTKEISDQERIQISLGAKDLRKLTASGTATIQVQELEQNYFQLVNLSATVLLQGKVDELRLSIEEGQVEGSRLEAERLFANIWSDGMATVNVSESLWCDLSNEGKLIYHGEPGQITRKTRSGGLLIAAPHQAKSEAAPVAASNGYIRFDLTNKTGAFINTFIKGPPDNPFGYGRPFKNGQTREEFLPPGTRVYLVNKLGMRSLLFVVEASDEGGEVTLSSE